MRTRSNRRNLRHGFHVCKGIGRANGFAREWHRKHPKMFLVFGNMNPSARPNSNTGTRNRCELDVAYLCWIETKSKVCSTFRTKLLREKMFISLGTRYAKAKPLGATSS